MNEKDLLYAEGGGMAGQFVFDEKVVRVFPDMIARSVPGYDLVVPMTGMLARRYAQPDSKLYDLGCSLGACTLAMRGAVNVRTARIVAVDASPAMVESCRKSLTEHPGEIAVDVIEADLAPAIELATSHPQAQPPLRDQSRLENPGDNFSSSLTSFTHRLF